MSLLEAYIRMVEQILEAPADARMACIAAFQHEVWEGEDVGDGAIDECLSGLALDLDFYEPDEQYRKEDPSFYGAEKLEQVVRNGLHALRGWQRP